MDSQVWKERQFPSKKFDMVWRGHQIAQVDKRQGSRSKFIDSLSLSFMDQSMFVTRSLLNQFQFEMEVSVDPNTLVFCSFSFTTYSQDKASLLTMDALSSTF